MIDSKDVEEGDFFRIDDNTIVRIDKKSGADFYDCSDGEVHSIDELLPVESVYLDIGSHPALNNDFLSASAGPVEEDGEQYILKSPAHVVQNRMRAKHGVEYDLNDKYLKESGYKYIC